MTNVSNINFNISTDNTRQCLPKNGDKKGEFVTGGLLFVDALK